MKRRNFFALFLGAIGTFFGLRAKPTLIERWDSGEIFYVCDNGERSAIWTSHKMVEGSKEGISQRDARKLLSRGNPIAVQANGKLIGASNPNHPVVRLNYEMSLAA